VSDDETKIIDAAIVLWTLACTIEQLAKALGRDEDELEAQISARVRERLRQPRKKRGTR
jgi:hypothetical protein